MPSFLQTFIMTNGFISTARKSSNKCLCDSPPKSEFSKGEATKHLLQKTNRSCHHGSAFLCFPPSLLVHLLVLCEFTGMIFCEPHQQKQYAESVHGTNNSWIAYCLSIYIDFGISHSEYDGYLYIFISMLIGFKQDLARLSFHTERSTSMWFGSALESANRKCRIRMVQILQLWQGVTLAMEVNGRRKELFRV